MKFLSFLMLAGSLHLSAGGFSQTVSLNERNATLQKVFNEVRRQTGYTFFYRDEWLRQTKKVSLQVKNAPLQQLLDACFEEQPLIYEIVDKTIIVRQRPAVAATDAAATAVQAFVPIRGVVRDDKGAPISGVSVVVRGTQKGTTTGSDGSFTLDARPGDVLDFSSVGYKPASITIGGSNVVNITLTVESKETDEIVIVGYGTARKSDVTGSISSYKPNELQAATAVSVDALLQGKVPGVNVVNSYSGPGAANSVVIRGANSLRGDNQPLYVIDNIPQASTGQFAASGAGDYQIPENPLATLNPNDIEDIQILKDASATAIYGSRGANGVILITTKKGKTGKPKITFNNNVSIANMVRRMNVLNLEQFADFKNRQTGGVPQYYKVGNEIRYVFSGSTYDPADPQSYRVLQEMDWQKEAFQTAVSTSHDLSISGGTDRNTYFISGDHKNVQGLVQNTKMQISNLRLNMNTEISKKLSLSFALSGGFRKNNMMSGGDSRGGASGSIVTASLYAAPFVYPADDPIWNSSAPDQLDIRSTPLSWISDYDDIAKEKTFRGSTQLTWKISNAFTYNLRTGGNITMQERARWFGLQLFRGLNDKGFLTKNELNRSNYTVENLLNYRKRFSKDVNLTALAGVTYDQYKFLNTITNGTQFQNMLLRTNGLHFASVITPYQPIQSDYQLLSFLWRVNLSLFGDRYLVTANFRSDGSSKFAETNRWAYFPSLALAWRLDREDFIRDQTWIRQLKLRLSYGKTGNQSIDPYSTLSSYTQGTYYATNSGDRVLAVNLAGLQNKNIKWETTASYNAGIDFSLFASRLSGSVDVYTKETSDLLISRDIAPSTAFGKLLLNQGSLRNRGVEINLSGDVLRKKDLTLTVGGNISFNKSEILRLGLPEGTFGNQTYIGYLGNSIGDVYGGPVNIFIQGQAPGLFWGYKTAGIYQGGGDTSDVKKSLTNAPPRPGDIHFVDLNGDSTINSSDMTIIGNPNPKFIYGFTVNAAYKRFTLSAAFNGVYGNQIFNANLRYLAMPARQTSTLRQDVYEQMWVAGKGGSMYPSATYNLPAVAMDRYVEDGSYLRWSDLTVAYSLPASLSGRIGMQSLNVYASCKNVLLLTNYSGFDPEVNSFAFDGLRRGIDLNAYPNARTFVLGLNLGF